MARYLTEDAAAADGIRIEHEPEAQRFAVYQQDGSERREVGEAHYSLPAAGVVDFDHTFVSGAYRGTGLSGLLARHALTSEVARGVTVRASCWFIEGYLAKHPELLETEPGSPA